MMWRRVYRSTVDTGGTVERTTSCTRTVQCCGILHPNGPANGRIRLANASKHLNLTTAGLRYSQQQSSTKLNLKLKSSPYRTLTANLLLEGLDVASEDYMWNVIRHLNQD
jgi:hypothetical protein